MSQSRQFWAFEHAVGTGIIVSSKTTDLSRGEFAPLRKELDRLIEEFEQAFSRFRSDSLVNRLALGKERVEFPQYAGKLFDIYDALFAATSGHFASTVAEKLVKLGYGEQVFEAKCTKYATATIPNASSDGRASASAPPREWPAQSITPPHWGDDIWRTPDEPNVLHTRRPVQLDFGAAGKGFLVDLMARKMSQYAQNFTINAGGDIYTTEPLRIGLENPWDTTQAVGILGINEPAALCASAPSRRHWTAFDSAVHAQKEVHHLIDGISGEPASAVTASWSYVPASATPNSPRSSSSAGSTAYDFPTAWADALSTALFVSKPSALESVAPQGWQFARLMDNKTAQQSHDWPGEFFL